jgi:hypothetical protein
LYFRLLVSLKIYNSFTFNKHLKFIYTDSQARILNSWFLGDKEHNQRQQQAALAGGGGRSTKPLNREWEVVAVREVSNRPPLATIIY